MSFLSFLLPPSSFSFVFVFVFVFLSSVFILFFPFRGRGGGGWNKYVRPTRPLPRPAVFVRVISLHSFAVHPPIDIHWHGQRNLLTLPARILFFFVHLSFFFRDRDLDLGFELGFDLDDEDLEAEIDEE